MKRTRSQSIGAQGERLLLHWFEESGHWIARKQEEDYGVDLEAELAEPEVQGHIIKIQVKASKCITIKRGVLNFQFDGQHLKYATTCRVPVILAVVDVANKKGWYLWLQGWALIRNHEWDKVPKLPKVVSLQIAEENTLAAGIPGRLREIAAWRTQEQLVIGLVDCIRSAVAVRERNVIEPIARLLKDLGQPTSLFPIGALIDEIISLGQRMWATEEGNRLSEILRTVCEKYGDKLSRDQIFRLVIRESPDGDGYSRTGINALSFLYERYTVRMRSLNLIELFGDHAEGLPRYYCQLVEKFPKSIDGGFYFCAEELDLRIGQWDIPKLSRERLFEKLVNRGASALLDSACRVT
jgi:hypothetical protein